MSEDQLELPLLSVGDTPPMPQELEGHPDQVSNRSSQIPQEVVTNCVSLLFWHTYIYVFT